MRSAARRLASLSVLSLCVACASRGSANGATRSSRELITQDQLSQLRFTNVVEAVQALRSNWLQTKGPDSFRAPSQVQVYLDDTRLGGVETLREIQLPSVVYIRHFDGVTATARWGLNHGQGVIFVSTRPNPDSNERAGPGAR